MRFLILGASGFLGRRLRHVLDQEGIEWLGTARQSQDNALISFDISRGHLLDCLPAGYFHDSTEETWVVHCTAFGSIDACFHHRSASWGVNVEGPQRVIEELQPYAVRHVLLSTNQVFDGKQAPYREEDAPRPLNEYGRQKLALERFCGDHVPRSIILRLDKVVSDRRGDGQLFDQWRTHVAASQPICCLPGQLLAPTLVSDVVAAILVACRRGLAGLYHTANPEVLQRRRLAELFLDVMGIDGEIKMVNEEDLKLAERRPRSAVLDSSKFIAAAGVSFTPARVMLEQFRDA